MKKLIILSIVLNVFSNIALSQQDTATYDEVNLKQKKGSINTYIHKNGETFSVGDTITLGSAFRNNTFEYILQNAGLSFYPVSNNAQNGSVIIKKMVIASRILTVYTTNPQGYVFGLVIVNFDSAVTSGEIKSNILTSDQALEELKKWKSKLDLGLITEIEYEKKKSELVPLIK